MLFSIYVIILALMLYRFAPLNQVLEPGGDPLSRSRTNAINGIFIMIVFTSHISGYIFNLMPQVSAVDWEFRTFNNKIGQLMVVPFLFFSGYGVTESMKNKGLDYVKAIPRRRSLTVLFNFDIAVFIFIITDLILGIAVIPKQCVLSLLVWDSVGNSNWYIFCVIFCYLASYGAYRIGASHASRLVILGIELIAYIAFLALMTDKEDCWFNITLAYWAGSCLSTYRTSILRFVNSHYVMCLVTAVALFMGFYLSHGDFITLRYNMTAMLFGFIIVLVMIKVSIHNKVLEWIGKNLFPLYIYQRLPMLILSQVAGGQFVVKHELLYILSCLVITVGIAFCYRSVKIK